MFSTKACAGSPASARQPGARLPAENARGGGKKRHHADRREDADAGEHDQASPPVRAGRDSRSPPPAARAISAVTRAKLPRPDCVASSRPVPLCCIAADPRGKLSDSLGRIAFTLSAGCKGFSIGGSRMSTDRDRLNRRAVCVYSVAAPQGPIEGPAPTGRSQCPSSASPRWAGGRDCGRSRRSCRLSSPLPPMPAARPPCGVSPQSEPPMGRLSVLESTPRRRRPAASCSSAATISST